MRPGDVLADNDWRPADLEEHEADEAFRPRFRCPTETKTCPECGKDFVMPASQAPRRTFCSRRCVSMHYNRIARLAAPTAEERFWAGVPCAEDPNVCWEWSGYRNNGGYGEIMVNRRRLLAHRWGYELFVAPIPAGLTIDHLCRNRACVNPAHLEPVEGKENTLRGEGITAKNARKTHCLRGHDLTTRSDSRHCIVCQRAKGREMYLTQRERFLAKNRAYYLANRDRILARQRERKVELDALADDVTTELDQAEAEARRQDQYLKLLDDDA